MGEGPEVLPGGGVDFLGVEKSSGPAKDTSVVLSKGTVTSTPYAGDAQILMELQPTYSNKREDAEVIATYDVDFRFPDPEYVSRTKRGNWGDVLTQMDDFTWKFLTRSTIWALQPVHVTGGEPRTPCAGQGSG